MRVNLVQIKLRPGGKRVRLEQIVEVESLYIGRGPDNDLCLQGLTTSLHHATIRKGDGNVYIEAAQGQEILVGGLPTPGERLAVDDEIRIGGWDLRLQTPEPGEDIRIEYEQRQLDDNAREALDRRTRVGIERGLFARRPLSWLALAAILVGFLALPLYVEELRPLWATGPVIRGHASIENDCAKCHGGLTRSVSNTACTTCHVDVRRHAPADLAMAALDDMDCADCHLEHRGREVSLADQGAAYCTSCHSDLTTQLSATKLPNASDFRTDHPVIHLAVVTDPDAPPTRISWPDEKEEVEENSGIKFDHHFHISQALDTPEDEEWLHCGQCHRMEEAGQAMQPVRYDRDCRRCHRLDAGIPELLGESGGTVLAHGDPERARDQLRVFYTSQVLEGRVRDHAAPRALRQRTPGPLISTDERARSARWIGQKVATADAELFEGEDGCAHCHQIVGGKVSEQTGEWLPRAVAPVQLQTQWIENARFSHAAHATQACSTCHPTAAIRDPGGDDDEEPKWAGRKSIPYGLMDEGPGVSAADSSTVIMIPGLETCRNCHVSLGDAGHQKIASPCSACHDFHDHALTPMVKADEANADEDEV
ncbi:MAG: cytochrome c3 family protein [Proteobacteria bacterium]|nr:cytochrome c3 family protein [Pseudomonadota bacterium]